MLRFFKRFVRDRRGQDLLEYALLAAFFGLCLVEVEPLIRTAISAFYQSNNTCTQDQWVMPDPGVSTPTCP